MARTKQKAKRNQNVLQPGSFTVEQLKQNGDWERRHEPTTRKKHKYALLCGYLGVKYHGLQIQPDPAINTVEKQLERAVFLAGGIQECNFGSFHKVGWQRAARTDKGVHAVGQVVALNLQIQTNEATRFVERCNAVLPDDIRVFDCIRVTNGFNPKMLCGSRRYQYLLPTYALQPKHVIESALKQAYDEHDVAKGVTPQQQQQEPTTDENGSRPKLTQEDLASVTPSLCDWRVDEETLSRLRAALNRYAGTSNFHNFTSKLRYTDKNAMRYIIKFECSDPFVDEKTGQEWVCLTVVGQSFLLHQIRKMVALAVEVARGGVPIEHMDTCFSSSKVLIPIAPGDGLHLDMLFYDTYNSKVMQMHNSAQPSKKRKTEEGATELSHAADAAATETKDGETKQEAATNEPGEVTLDHRPLDWDANPDVSERILEFKRSFIWRHIFDSEFSQRTTLLWLDACRFLSYRFQVVPDDIDPRHPAKPTDAEGDVDAGEQSDDDAGAGDL